MFIWRETEIHREENKNEVWQTHRVLYDGYINTAIAISVSRVSMSFVLLLSCPPRHK